MDAATEKHVKEQLNEAMQYCDEKDVKENDAEEKELEEIDEPSSNTTYIGDIDGDSPAQKSLKQIQEIFQKTEAMKLVAKEKNKELEDQFKDLKQRLNSSSEYLTRIKKNIENLKFSYQKNVLELHKNLDPATEVANRKYESKEDMAKYMEDIRKKIDDLQIRMTSQREKQQQVTESYEEAFDKVVDALQKIDSGEYCSKNLLGNAGDSIKPNNSSGE